MTEYGTVSLVLTAKKKLFSVLILPVLLYAGMTYPFTATALTKIHVQTNKLLGALGSARPCHPIPTSSLQSSRKRQM
jgi:hypothetical protein